MDWLELHLDTSPVGIEPMSALLEQQGVEALSAAKECPLFRRTGDTYSQKDYHPLCGCAGKSYTFAEKINLPMNEQKQVRQPFTGSHKGRFC